jgi:proteasome lid subunit RPN8/RPN11
MNKETIILKEPAYRYIIRHATETYPEECCGIIIGTILNGRRVITEVRETKNTHSENHTRRYLISPDEYRKAEEHARSEKKEIIGFYHSHPDHPAIPSDFDREYAWPWFLYIIIEIRNADIREIRGWQLHDDRSGFKEIKLLNNEAMQED